MNIYTGVVAGAWAVFIVYWAISGAQAKPSKATPAARRVILLRTLLLLVLALAAVLAGKAGDLVRPHPLFPALGSALTVIGIACAIWARYHLGRNWGMPMTEKQGRELITSGPYAYVRHPIYTGVILALIGSAGVSGGLWLIIALTGIVYFVLAAHEEEAMLTKEFPGSYPEYRAGTKMLIPFIW